MIRGFFEEGRPFVLAVVSIPRLAILRSVRFLVDTGSDSTLIHPEDSSRLGLDPLARTFDGAARRRSAGIGGVVEDYVEPCVLIFQHSDGAWERTELPIAFALPTISNQTFPSLLGRDVLRHYRLIHDLPRDILTLE